MTDKQSLWQCSLPHQQPDRISLGHGSGGQLSQNLLEQLIYPAFDNPILAQGHDSALLAMAGARLAFTTDSYVVKPLFFPGGDIGKLAVCGTINDLAMAGATPRYLSCSLILEEGLETAILRKVLASMAQSAAEVGVQLVTGDTKVVERGKCDHLYINTAGIGLIEHNLIIAPQNIADGDTIILSGDIGRHGMAVMAQREGLQFENPLHSDCGNLWQAVQAMLSAGIDIHCLRDLTRGGLATALIELAEASGLSFTIDEGAIPVSAAVNGACEMLGLTPDFVANEGRFIACIPAAHVEKALLILQSMAVSADSTIIGKVVGGGRSQVIYRNRFGNERLLHRLSGEQLPRIC